MISFFVGFLLSYLLYIIAEKAYYYSIGFKVIKEKDFVGFVKSVQRTTISSLVSVLIVSYFAGPLSYLFTTFATFYLFQYCLIDYKGLEENYKEIRAKYVY